MPKKIPLVSVRVSRDGVSVTPPIGAVFDFTKEELADLEKLSKATGTDYVRDPVNEAPAEDGEKKSPKGAKGASSDL